MMSGWLRRFGLHIAAAVGATAVFVAAATVGASQNRDPAPVSVTQPAASPVVPERSLRGTIREVSADSIVVLGSGGREWRVTPAPGALIRLNGKTAKLDALRAEDSVVILGQAQRTRPPSNSFLAHAITARRK